MTESAAAPNSSETSVKETIESILIAFILAFMFRAFVVEAFVIPTGSMAPTLMGAHLRYRCEDCGYEFTVNYSAPGDGDDVSIPSRAGDTLIDANGNRPTDRQGNLLQKVFHVICPNCGYRVQKSFKGSDPNNSADNPPVHYGDRILVLKYLYLLRQPHRWDVVVFKSPDNPAKYDYQQNFIKRLIGLPGETIMLLDGDVYVAPNKPGVNPTPEDFVVQTKPREVQEALWRIVYDNDYHPQNSASGRAGAISAEPAWTQPWMRRAGQTGWQPLDGRVFQFDNPEGAAEIFFDASANRDKQSLTDWLAYDVTVNQDPRADQREGPDAFNRQLYTADDNVADVQLSFFYQRTSGDGKLRAELSKIDRTFIAEIGQGKATLYQRVDGEQERVVQSVPLNVDPATPTRIDLINCDYQVTLRVNDREVIRTTPEQYAPDIRKLLDAFKKRNNMEKPSIRIVAGNQKCLISHLGLWRDVYYMNRVPNFNGGGRLNHATPEDFPNMLMRLNDSPPDTGSEPRWTGPEYFCCGDNSPISGDGRYWDAEIKLPGENLFADDGKVPGRFLLGKAFFVYWPAGFRPLDSAPALVPNFGEMRFIH